MLQKSRKSIHVEGNTHTVVNKQTQDCSGLWLDESKTQKRTSPQYSQLIIYQISISVMRISENVTQGRDLLQERLGLDGEIMISTAGTNPQL